MRASLGRKGDQVVGSSSSTVLLEDEVMGPALEDLVLVNVLGLVDSGLPGHVREAYRHSIDRDSRRLSDYRQQFGIRCPPPPTVGMSNQTNNQIKGCVSK